MPLRAKPPILKPDRFKTVIYGKPNAGKSHFVTNIPHVYMIDTEGLEDYAKFMEYLTINKGNIIRINDLNDIISEVKSLMKDKHDYKTLVIDSISVPFNNLSILEVDRLQSKSVKDIEGTEFGANKAKPTRLLSHLGTLLTRLDMNIIVTAKEKAEYEGDHEIGKMPDVGNGLSHDLGSAFHLYTIGGKRMVSVKKSRYKNIKDNEKFEFDHGYEILKERFGEEMFLRDSLSEKFATNEQIEELDKLIKFMNVSDELKQKWLSKFCAKSFDEFSESNAQKIINFLKTQGEQNV